MSGDYGKFNTPNICTYPTKHAQRGTGERCETLYWQLPTRGGEAINTSGETDRLT